LGERYHLVELGSTRSLVVPVAVSPAGNTAALFGGIQYEIDSTTIAVPTENLPVDELGLRGSSGFAYTDSTLRGGEWGYLPATEKEITVTDQILQKHGFQTAVRRGTTATEEALQSIGQGKTSPRILHIATHGFFFPDPKSEVRSEKVRSEMSEPVFKISDNPMIRSGLLLAGANYAWKTGKPLRPDMADQILTAYEISQMNLRNTELVVLSACETGLGKIEGNEGVYGLQRAFKIAGAKYLLMSLWKVPDGPTQELMEAFYKNWLEGGKDIPDAFREAQATMRAKYSNPFFWAGFVLVE
jgi:CHAT domain-containing protein